MMKRFELQLALLAATLIALCGCHNKNKGPEGTEQVSVIETKDGALLVDTIDVDATVTAVDPAARKITITTPGSQPKTFKVAKDIDLAQFRAGDQIAARVTDEVAVLLTPGGAAPSEVAADTVALAAAGKDSAVFVADSMRSTARVTAVDPKHHKVTLQFADGSIKTIKTSKKIDLSKVAVGDNVTVEVAEAMALDLKRAP
jgi:hypothetical protein